MLAEGAGGPDAKLSAAAGIDPVADRQDGVEVEELDLPCDLATGLPLNRCIFCNGSPLSSSPEANTLRKCREITDLSCSNSAAIWVSDSQTVSCSSRTSTRMPPSGV